jgi:two-component system sensor histidine kinase UhpB
LSLKLRLNLIITGLLFLIMLAGAMLTINNARQNVRAEVESSEKLALYLFDTGILDNTDLILKKPSNKPFRLQSLRHMRHLKIEFYDAYGHLLDTNQSKIAPNTENEAPDWFEYIMEAVTPPWESKIRSIDYEGQTFGKLVITPDPTYEYAEIWKQTVDILLLVLIFFVAVNMMISWAVGQVLKPTERIMTVLNELERGNLKARLPTFRAPEMARIGLKFNLMVETLEQSIYRNHRLSQQLITLQEEERKNLARDLHDEFGQCLTAIHTDASVVLKLSETKYPEIRDSALAVTELSRHLMDMVSGLLQRLRPGILDELGLALAIEDLVETWKAHNEKVACNLTISDSMPEYIEEAVRITAYRLMQECLTNVSRHSGATAVKLAMNYVARDGGRSSGLQISVRDNGKGFDVAGAGGFGLPGMRERVEGLGGEFMINTHPGNGTEITAWIPMRLVQS